MPRSKERITEQERKKEELIKLVKFGEQLKREKENGEE